jgi:RHS repeat-associated protein
MPTDFGFTSQRNENSFGLMDYNARYYSPRLGRFVSADTVIPGAGNPLAWDRYGYVLNNPLRYADPSGHSWCEEGVCIRPTQPSLKFHAPLNYMAQKHNDDYPYCPGSDCPNGYHAGSDYTANIGTPVRSSSYGTVVVADTCTYGTNCDYDGDIELGKVYGYEDVSQVNKGYGNVVIIEYRYNNLTPEVRKIYGVAPSQSLYMLYAHLENAPTVRVGDWVYPGKVIGNTGSTGNSTGPHLHLEVRVADSGTLAGGEMCTANTCYDSFETAEGYPAWENHVFADNARYGQWAEMTKYNPALLHSIYYTR